MRHFVRTALLAAALSSPVAANADTFLAGSSSVIDGQAVVLDLSGQLINGLAGQVQLNGAGPDAGTNFLLWCIGITTGISLPYNYTVTGIPLGGVANGFPGVPNLDAAQVRQMASLAFAGDNQAGIDKAAVQLAIWKTEYGNSLTFLGLSPTLTADTNALLAATVLGGLLDRADASLRLFTDLPANPSQPFADVTINAVPIPAVGTGLPGLIAAFYAIFSWRKRKWQARQLAAA